MKEGVGIADIMYGTIQLIDLGCRQNSEKCCHTTVIPRLPPHSFSEGRKLRYQHFEDKLLETSQINEHPYHDF